MLVGLKKSQENINIINTIWNEKNPVKVQDSISQYNIDLYVTSMLYKKVQKSIIFSFFIYTRHTVWRTFYMWSKKKKKLIFRLNSIVYFSIFLLKKKSIFNSLTSIIHFTINFNKNLSEKLNNRKIAIDSLDSLEIDFKFATFGFWANRQRVLNQKRKFFF